MSHTHWRFGGLEKISDVIVIRFNGPKDGMTVTIPVAGARQLLNELHATLPPDGASSNPD